MKIKTPVELAEQIKLAKTVDEIFDGDALQRRPIVENLTNLIVGTEQAVLAIDASWGNGKTSFVAMLQRYLELNQILVEDGQKVSMAECIYFNAWSSDFSEVKTRLMKMSSGDMTVMVDELAKENLALLGLEKLI